MHLTVNAHLVLLVVVANVQLNMHRRGKKCYPGSILTVEESPVASFFVV